MRGAASVAGGGRAPSGHGSRSCPTTRRPPRSPSRSISRAAGARVDADVARGTASTAPGCSWLVGKKRRVRRMAPSLRLRASRISPRCPRRSSVEPPPMSHTSSLRSNTGHRLEHAEVDEAGLLEPRDHLDVDAGLVRARSMNSARFSASRTALVATARIGAPWIVGHLPEPVEGRDATVDGRRRQPLHVARPPSRGAPSPSRGRPPRSGSRPTRATTRWTEFVPMSTAARTLVAVPGARSLRSLTPPL